MSTQRLLSYSAGALTSIGHLLVRATQARQAGAEARRAARATFDPDAAEALNAAADALDVAGVALQCGLALARATLEDLMRAGQRQ